LFQGYGELSEFKAQLTHVIGRTNRQIEIELAMAHGGRGLAVDG
jgi:hypothetical protein